jgi:hypothetical protein
VVDVLLEMKGNLGTKRDRLWCLGTTGRLEGQEQVESRGQAHHGPNCAEAGPQVQPAVLSIPRTCSVSPCPRRARLYRFTGPLRPTDRRERTREAKVSQEEKSKRETTCGPMQETSCMKKFQAMLDEGDSDCAQMMSRMRAMCCGTPERAEDQEESV